jgi:hypothetical protein
LWAAVSSSAMGLFYVNKMRDKGDSIGRRAHCHTFGL